MSQEVTLTVDGKVITVPKGTTVYHAAQKVGVDIPIFCYQDRMPPFGACRMCLVEVEKSPKLQTSCTLEAAEGMVVKTQSQMALEGRESIIELLLLNHPLDCPICDRGGECPLQENAIAHGPGKSRFFEAKRRFKKPLPMGPVLELDRERCIVCARCTRFGDVIAGDHALEFIERGYKTEVGTPGGGPADSKFIGNTIMICPVGALTSRVYRFRARPWDNTPTNSTCTLCPVGCSMIFDSRDGEIMRTRSRENRDINDIWMCDKGWFGYEYTSHPDRLKTPLVRKNGQLQPASWDEALQLVAEKMTAAKKGGKVAALGGNPLTIEENYLYQKLFRQGVGTHHIDHRVGGVVTTLEDEGLQPGMEITIGDCEQLSYVVLCGLDITEEFPVIWLRLKQAVNKGAKLLFMGHFAPEIAQYLSHLRLHAPGDEMEVLRQEKGHITALTGKGAIFVGKQYLSSPHRKEILSALCALKQDIPDLSLNIMEGRNNSLGARFAGMRPDLGAFGIPVTSPGLNTVQILEAAARDGWDYLHVAGANPAAKVPSRMWKDIRSKLGFLVVQDLFLNETARDADVVLPTLSYAEKGGTFLTIDGHMQTLAPGKEIPNDLHSDGDIFLMLGHKLNLMLRVEDSFTSKLQLRRIPFVLPRTIASVEKKKEQSPNHKQLLATFAAALFDHGVRMKHNPRTVQLAKAPKVRMNPREANARGLKDGDTVRVTRNENAVTARLKIDSGVADGTIVLPLGFEEVPVNELGLQLHNGFAIEVHKKG